MKIIDLTSDSKQAPARDRTAEKQAIEAALKVTPEKLTLDQLEQARTLIENAMYILDTHLTSIRLDLEENELHADNIGWLRKATHAERIKASQRQRLQNLFGAVNRRLKVERARQNLVEFTVDRSSREARFIQLAKAHLSKETFKEIWRAVDAEFEERKQKESP